MGEGAGASESNALEKRTRLLRPLFVGVFCNKKFTDCFD
jgi:hypothetical protein